MNVVITGANRGIGLSFVKHYLANGAKVFAACREASPELGQSGAQIIEDVDVSTDQGIETLSGALQGVNIDVLINNAGILRDEQLGNLNIETIRDQFEINALAPLRVTEALANNLGDNAKVALVTSRMGSISDNTSGGRYGYRMSKAALNAAGMSLAQDLKGRGVAVAILHPGLVGTDMIGGYGDITPDQAAERLIARINELNLANTGTFWHSNGEVLPW
ncbi:SDR family oxidoreductase [Gilvimarinus sp. SDUM040013]|uniref:SDR family oxidoreductase n=1 Tax=Gilvimarinus gilvus TaxID=3058038 RepID=A0ABU4S2Q6_9GAMM|nr:SDR family oxidoreductase [Gilvimarinus sp. SDUM040013]MDO3384899.1 SDR family oxidoreductase [Gilvimarinus sp. SDUM040013]MDX6850676.1 SDR family oxidoreductase [Gilvimarinus sp. SDUM040013]